MNTQKADIGVVGLAVMGENLILNMESRGFTVACYNRTVGKVDAFIGGRGAGKRLIGCRSIQELVDALKPPRRIMLMVKAGQPVDDFIAKTAPLLSPGDILIDGGNSHYPDTIRRSRELEARGLLFIGTGVSGGEEGALKGPAIMPGGHPGAWPHVKPIFQSIAAKVADGSPCCDWIGTDGAGHFVKMVHNGIEYGDMQLICEVYHLLSQGLGLTTDEMHAIFAEWNRGVLDSYLIEITRDILAKRDEETGVPVVDLILDAAGQKGTGKWTSQAGLDFGVAIPTIAEAVFARCLSAIKEERVAAARSLRGPRRTFRGDKAKFIAQLHDALYASKICSYAQGYQLMRAAAAEMDWKLDYGRIAQIWRGGCIIRAQFLDHIRDAFARKPKLANLLLDPYFKKAVRQAQPGWRKVLTTAIQLGIPCPAMSAALSYYDGYRCARLPANLLQAQRDYFGAHTYERVDHPRGVFFHTNWTGEGGATASTAYTV
ncbi:MAG: decarboxylating NADP(+)-dependent phosphogluconate dehydrogenase [Lentisphaerae bacterium]|jgi:6-phosphogluconate dehydrogenase|nr:decarboxylating NADP(+)-dependent phosphogluconate dehydrogenase [Lentisphaerota bacterium]